MTSARRLKHAHDWKIPGRELRVVASAQRMDAIGALFPRERHQWYILKGRKPVPVTWSQQLRWAREENGNHRMTVTVAKERAGQYTVSTIFLGMDHAYGDGPPVLFETMAWLTEGGKFRDEQYRYCTWDEAMKGHKQYAQRLRMQLVEKKITQQQRR